MSTNQTTARNKATIGRLHDALNNGDEATLASLIEEVIAPDVLVRTPLPLGVTGTAAVTKVFTTLRHAFPDLRVTVEDTIAEGDKVVSRNRVTGTHRGAYMGVAATGASVAYDEIFVFRFADGRIAETWGVVDVLTQLRQLGVAPAGPPARFGG